MPSAAHSGGPSSATGRKPAFTTLAGSVMQRLETSFTAWLDQNVEADGPPATDPQPVLESIRAGDVVLVAGRTRMSRFIRFLRLPVDARSALPRPLGGVRRRPRSARSDGARLPRRPERTCSDRGAPRPRDHPHPSPALPYPRREDLPSKHPLRAAGEPGDPVCGAASGFRLRSAPHPGPRAPRPPLAIVCAALALDPVRPRLRGIRALYLLDPTGAIVHLRGPPRRRGGGAPQRCGLQGVFGGEPAARDTERLRRIPLFRISRVSAEFPGGRSGKAGPAVATGQGSAGTGRRQTVPSWSVSRPGPEAMLRHGADASSTSRETVNRTIPPVFNRGASGTWRDQGAGLRF